MFSTPSLRGQVFVGLIYRIQIRDATAKKKYIDNKRNLQKFVKYLQKN